MSETCWNGQKWLNMVSILEMAGKAGNGQKWLELAGNGWTCPEMARR